MRWAALSIVWLALAANAILLVENARTMASLNRLHAEAEEAMVQVRKNAATVKDQLSHPCYQGMTLQPGESCTMVVPIPGGAMPNP